MGGGGTFAVNVLTMTQRYVPGSGTMLVFEPGQVAAECCTRRMMWDTAYCLQKCSVSSSKVFGLILGSLVQESFVRGWFPFDFSFTSNW
jgi:hypothetical protein